MQLVSAHLPGRTRLPGLQPYIFIIAATREAGSDASWYTSFCCAGGCNCSGGSAGIVKTAHCHCADRGAAAGCRRRCRPGLHSSRTMATHQRVLTSGCRVCVTKLKVITAELHGGTKSQDAGSLKASYRQQPARLTLWRAPCSISIYTAGRRHRGIAVMHGVTQSHMLLLHYAQGTPRLRKRKSHTAE